MKKSKRVSKPVAQVIEELEGQKIPYTPEIDRGWVWLIGDMRGCGKRGCECAKCKEQSQLREKIKAIGFCFKFEGEHELPSGEVSRWAHSCETPMKFKRVGIQPSDSKQPLMEVSDSLLAAALGL